MLRKDVKLGFAIGGVMLAVVVVYVLVVPNSEKKTAQVVDENATQVAPVPGKPDATVGENKSEKPPEVSVDTSKVSTDNVGEKVAVGPATAPSNATADNSSVWDTVLRDGRIPPSMSATPGPTPKTETGEQPANDKVSAPSSGADNTPTRPTAGVDSKSTDSATIDNGSDAQLANSTTAGKTAATGQTTHVVAAGETLSSIAASSYGSAKAWKRISEANPNVNPNRLTAGTKLIIPAASAASGSASSSSATPADSTRTISSSSTEAVNPQTEYQVRANDSLYRISMRLYGKADHVEKLYEDNKDLIGADKRHLKVGSILKLSDPPAASVTNATR